MLRDWLQGSIVAAAAVFAAVPAMAQDASVAQPGGKIAGLPGVALVKIAEGFVDPLRVVSAKDGTGRLFVVERHGVIKIVDKDGKTLPKPFLDIHGEVVSSFLEQGLYDLAFHPDFKKNGKFYVHYSDMIRNGASMVVEFKVSADDPNKADRDSAKPVWIMARPYANHNGGQIAFGPDGFLYIGSGDGGWEGDPLNAGQDIATLCGKMLRIDVNVPEGSKAGYLIPESNPFVQKQQMIKFFGVPEEEFAKIQVKALPEIWAYGLRNPWTFHFDSKTGDMYIGDVGQNEWEEVDFQPASSKGGENYGWKFLQGSHPFPASTKQIKVGVLPAAEYSHAKDGSCVIGLGIYRGSDYPAFDGTYFVVDWGSGKLWGLKRDAAGMWQFQELLDTQLHFTGGGPNEDGVIYVASCGCAYGDPVDPTAPGHPRGAIWKIVPADKAPAGAETAPLDKPAAK